MGIGTLIIFIATILVAAVAAAVIISTSNVLQQRSLLVGQEARKAITNSIEVISILSASDTSTETFNDFEILVRLSPGSDPLQMRKFSIEYISLNFDEGATLQYSSNESVVQLGQIANGTNTTVYDLDGDGTTDVATLIIDAYGSNEGVRFYLSNEENWSDIVDVGANLVNATSTNVTLDLAETAITYNESVYGYITIDGQTDTDDVIVADVNVTVSSMPATCRFDYLQPESRYCFEVVNGNSDYVLNSGERFRLLYRLKTPNEISIGQDFQFIFTSEKGRLSEARARTPDVVVSSKSKLWPLG